MGLSVLYVVNNVHPIVFKCENKLNIAAQSISYNQCSQLTQPGYTSFPGPLPCTFYFNSILQEQYNVRKFQAKIVSSTPIEIDALIR